MHNIHLALIKVLKLELEDIYFSILFFVWIILPGTDTYRAAEALATTRNNRDDMWKGCKDIVVIF